MNQFQTRIIKYLASERYQPSDILEIATALDIQEDDLDQFTAEMQQLIADGRALSGKASIVTLPPPGKELEGLFRLNRRGFGFIIPENPVAHGDLFVPAQNTGTAMTGDRVCAKVIHEPRRVNRGRGASQNRAHASGKSPYIGKITHILQRADKCYTGNLQKQGSQYLVITDGSILSNPVIIRDPHSKNAKPGDKVVIELIEYPDEKTLAQGVILEVLGEQGLPSVETSAVMRAYNLSDDFPKDVTDQARQMSRDFNDREVPSDRLDLTGEMILTIDPPDAKDYDDAIHVKRLSADEAKGAGFSDAVWELGVHIADVSHFVVAGSVLDEEAYARGNSAYLPRKVVPMLPEVLSNGVCSLQEGVNRFTRTAFIYYDKKGTVLGERFAKAVINSKKRLTYLEAEYLIAGDTNAAKEHARAEPTYSKKIIASLGDFDALAKIIHKRRAGDGMIELSLPEVELVYDEDGRVTDAVPEDDAYTHKIIEMFMVEANEASARLFNDLNIPMIRRIHPDPPARDMNDLQRFARVAGFQIPLRPTRQELQQLLVAVKGKPQQHAINLALLQTLSKAEYSPANIGHFALASKHYSHFTSPIRRYPDLVLHRAIDAYLDLYPDWRKSKLPGKPGSGAVKALAKKIAKDPRCVNEERLGEIGLHCSTTERNAESAERELRNYLVLDLLTQFIGDHFDGTVTGVTNNGIFVQIDRFLVDGMIKKADLPGDARERWALNRQTGALTASKSGKTISIGQRFVVQISNCNPVARQLDLLIVEEGVNGHKSKTKQKKLGQETKRLEKKKTKKKKPSGRGRGKSEAAGDGGGDGTQTPGQHASQKKKHRKGNSDPVVQKERAARRKKRKKQSQKEQDRKKR